MSGSLQSEKTEKKLVFTNFLLWEKDHITKKQIQSAILTYIPTMQIELQIILQKYSDKILYNPRPRVRIIINLPGPLINMALLTFNVFSINLNYINYKTVYTFVDFDNYVFNFIFR